MLQIVVIAIVVGIAALRSGKAAEPFLGFTRSALAIVQKILWWVIRLAPLGTLGLIGRAVATYGWDLLAPLGSFAVAIYVGLALVLFVVYPVILRTNGLGILSFFRGAWPAIELAFVSRSSVGTLPVTQRVVERNLGVPRSYASFAVPLAATTKMDGCASIYPAISAIFVAQLFGIDLSVTDYLLIAFVSVVGSAATAGPDRRGGHADPHAVDARAAAGRRRPAARDRPDPRHGPHRRERRRSGAGADDRREARGHPRPRAVRVGVRGGPVLRRRRRRADEPPTSAETSGRPRPVDASTPPSPEPGIRA